MVKDKIQVKVRPLSNPSLEKASLLGAARVYVSKDSLISLTGTLDSGRLCFVESRRGQTPEDAKTKQNGDGEETIRREASLWAMPGQDLSPNVVVMTKAFREATDFRLGDLVTISLGAKVPDAQEVLVQPVEESSPESARRYPVSWELPISLALERAEQVYPGMLLEGVSVHKLRRDFKVLSVNGATDSIARFEPPSTTIRVLAFGADSGAPETSGSESTEPPSLVPVPGMDKESKEINLFLRKIGRPNVFKTLATRSNVLCIHGPHGTGKTFILKRLEATGWGKTHWIRSHDKPSTIRETIKQARTQQPSFLFIDELEKLLHKDRSDRNTIIRILCEELDSLFEEANSGEQPPRVAVIVTCLDYITDVPYELTSGTRMRRDISLPIPGEAERREVLKSMNLPLDPAESDSVLNMIAHRTHAFSQGDLKNLMLAAAEHRENELFLRDELPEGDLPFTSDDLEYALKVTKASAMHGINLKPPKVRWDDIGGQDEVKEALQDLLMFSGKDSKAKWTRMVKNPPKSLMLYGPSGCSKTLSAQALATESSYNFFAVKGAELLDMYVGESERAIRSLFQRARAAAPSIIFFDEIESIGRSRSGPGSRGGSNVNTVTTLLNELDGFEALQDVLVIAATNRPEQIDSAILRPGRFDKRIFVGPPNQVAREAIFKIRLRGLDLASDLDIAELARLTDGYTGAEVTAICNEAGMAGLKREGSEISMEDMKAAIAKTHREVTQAVLDQYQKWEKQFVK